MRKMTVKLGKAALAGFLASQLAMLVTFLPYLMYQNLSDHRASRWSDEADWLGPTLFLGSVVIGGFLGFSASWRSTTRRQAAEDANER